MKYLLIILASVLLASGARAAQAPSENCLDPKEVKDIWKFSFGSNNPKIDVNADYVCKPASLVNRTWAALIYLKKHSLLPKVNLPVSQNILGADAWKYFTSRIQEITFEADGEGTCYSEKDKSGEVLHVDAYVEPDTDEVHICDSYAKQDLLTQVSTLIHESRHVNDFPHVRCSQGALKGADAACDPSYVEYKGAYAAGAELQLRLAKDETVDPALRSSLRLGGILDLTERFNKVPFGLHSALIVQDAHGSLSLIDGEKILPLEAEKSGGLLVGSDLVYPSESTVRAFSVNQWSDDSGSPFWKAFISEKENFPRGSIVGSAGDDNYDCFLFAQQISCSNYDTYPNLNYVTVILSKIHPVSILYQDASTLIKAHTLLIVGDDGFLYELPKKFEDFKKSAESDFKAIPNTNDILSVVSAPNDEKTEYMVTRSGKVLKTSAKGLVPVPGFEEMSLRVVSKVRLGDGAISGF
jgi:hypothetical protein